MSERECTFSLVCDGTNFGIALTVHTFAGILAQVGNLTHSVYTCTHVDDCVFVCKE